MLNSFMQGFFRQVNIFATGVCFFQTQKECKSNLRPHDSSGSQAAGGSRLFINFTLCCSGSMFLSIIYRNYREYVH